MRVVQQFQFQVSIKNIYSQGVQAGVDRLVLSSLALERTKAGISVRLNRKGGNLMELQECNMIVLKNLVNGTARSVVKVIISLQTDHSMRDTCFYDD